MKNILKNGAIYMLIIFTLVFTSGCSQNSSVANVEETSCNLNEEEVTKST